MFYTLQNLRNKLVENDDNNLNLINPLSKQDNLKIDMIKEMIMYLFEPIGIEITIIDPPRTTPKTKTEISSIFKENHETSSSGHSGFNRTYKQIKENYY